MKHLFLIFLSSLLIFSCNQNGSVETVSLKNTNNDLEKFNLNGRVKSLRETKFLAINNFSIVEHGEKKKHLYNQEILFNLDGNKIEKNDYLTDGTLANRTMYLYQDNKLVEYNNYDPEGVPFGIGKYEYDQDGNLKRLIDNTNDGRTNWTKTFRFDDHGNVIEMEKFKTEDAIERKEIYNYDGNNNIIESDFYKKDKLIAKNNHKYDADGNIIELNYSDSNVYTFKYSYDYKGNWVKKIVFIDGNPSGILLREIEYFK